MLSIFSCAYCSSVCLLWRNVSLGLLPIFWLGCLFFFVIGLYELFVCFRTRVFLMERNKYTVSDRRLEFYLLAWFWGAAMNKEGKGTSFSQFSSSGCYSQWLGVLENRWAGNKALVVKVTLMSYRLAHLCQPSGSPEEGVVGKADAGCHSVHPGLRLSLFPPNLSQKKGMLL